MWRDLITTYYLPLKALHLIALISWMAALLYLPRLFVYHAEAGVQSPCVPTFQMMQRRLARFIMTPAMIATFLFGGLLLAVPGMWSSPAGWLHGKLFLVLLMAAYHGFLIKNMKAFAKGHIPHSGRFFRVLNEVPTLLMILIVFLVVLKPF